MLLLNVGARCNGLWDYGLARFTPCGLVFLSALPLVIASIAVLVAFLGDRLIPYFARPFFTVDPLRKRVSDLNPFSAYCLLLSGLACVGSAFSIAQLFNIHSKITKPITPALELASWVLVALFIVTKRPKLAPINLLFYYASLVVLHVAFLSTKHLSKLDSVYHSVQLTAALTSCLSASFMPFRFNPSGDKPVSQVGETPSDQARSPEDNIRLWQFLSVSWISPMLSVAKERKLNEDDVWLLPSEFQHKPLYERFRQVGGSFILRLIKANAFDLFLITCFSLVDLACDFATPLLLHRLLQSMENPAASVKVTLVYAVFSLIAGLIQVQEQVLMTWFGRRCYERSRGQMILLIYEKALNRKNFSSKPKPENSPEQNGEASENGVTNSNEEPPNVNGVANGSGGNPNGNGLANGNSHNTKPPKRNWFKNLWSRNKSTKEEKPLDPASTGKVLNIIRGDVYEVAQRFWEFGDLLAVPLGAIVAVALVWTLLGPSCLLAMITVFITQGLIAFLSRYQIAWTKKRKAARDERLQASSQYIEVIRHLRWYGWQNEWLENVLKIRKNELWVRIGLQSWFILIAAVNIFSLYIFPVIAFATFTLLDKHELRIDLIFPALQIFDMVNSRLREIPQLITTLANASTAASRIETFLAEPEKELPADTLIHSNCYLDNCTFSFPETTAPVLNNVTISIDKGLTLVIGKVGAGKSALLQSILGEMDLKSGNFEPPNGSIGYCAQTPWLQSMSIRDNILFFSKFDSVRYHEVIDACELVADFDIFKDGDMSNIGENGIGLSGGQKARVALARAVYSQSPTLLLDDPISALDHDTAEAIIIKLFTGSLIKNRTVVLATHRVDLFREHCYQILEVESGSVHQMEGFVASKVYNRNEPVKPENGDDKDAKKDANDAAKFIEDEFRADWGVQFRVYWTWIKAGKFKYWALLSSTLAMARVISLSQSWFLKTWGEAYAHTDSTLIHNLFVSPRTLYSAIAAQGIDFNAPFKDYPRPEDDVKPWLLTYLAVNMAQVVNVIIFRFSEMPLMYSASVYLYEHVMRSVSGATFRYYDVTPVGRLLNRLTSDIQNVDGMILWQFEKIILDCLHWSVSAIVIASITPPFLIFCLFLLVLYATIFMRYLPSSQSLRRLETVSLSPLFANFGELLQGLTTVRAFRAQQSFQNNVIATVDRFQGMDHFYWSLQAWLGFRFNALSAFAKFALTAIALYLKLSPGLTAFTLIQANSFVSATKDLCKRYGDLQMEFIAVERVEELLHIEQEPLGTIQPPAHWPNYNSQIEFDNVSIKYAPNLDPVIIDASIVIPAGSSTAVMGRTGSGKSTLVASILAVVRATSGRILIDGIDVAEVDINTLRRRVTFVAQEPVLFSGSIRHNLDPLKEFSDEECANVLERVCGDQGWTLESEVESGGRNISQGQRQLVGITRAVLRRSPIIILDEATASIDLETSMKIQRILREEMKQSTVITIAHRLEAVRDADFAIIMDHGKVAYCGPADSMPKKTIEIENEE